MTLRLLGAVGLRTGARLGVELVEEEREGADDLVPVKVIRIDLESVGVPVPVFEVLMVRLEVDVWVGVRDRGAERVPVEETVDVLDWDTEEVEVKVSLGDREICPDRVMLDEPVLVREGGADKDRVGLPLELFEEVVVRLVVGEPEAVLEPVDVAV